jgi:hypothetical protein
MLNDYKQNRAVVSLADKLEFGEIYSPFSLIVNVFYFCQFTS